MANHPEENNVYAQSTVHNKIIHISEAKSGRQGYFCLGCKSEMQAVLFKIPNHISYFRHDPKEVDYKLRCTYSDEEHRRLIAKNILARLKKLKVPPLYKYPPKGSSDLPFKISDAKIIEAHDAYPERYFYETEDGEIKWGEKEESTGLTFLLKADVVLVDRDNNVILLIDFVTKHKKLDAIAKTALKSLQIDAVQVRVPKDSPEEIEKSLSKTDRTKWAYSYEQERTEYVRVPGATPGEILPIDELQRELFEENFFCRQSEIRNLIRSIARCLESKPYRESDEGLGAELYRVKEELEQHRQRREELRNRIEEIIGGEYSARRGAISEENERIEKEKVRLEQLSTDLEKRYIRKGLELDQTERDLRKRVEVGHREKGTRGSTVQSRKGDLGRAIASEREEIARIENIIANLPEKFKQEEQRTRRESEEIEAEFRRKEGELSERIKNGDGSINDELSRGIEEIVNIRGIINDSIEKQSTLNRNRSAWKSFNKGAYKSWNL
jgi:hypothetical protein